MCNSGAASLVIKGVSALDHRGGGIGGDAKIGKTTILRNREWGPEPLTYATGVQLLYKLNLICFQFLKFTCTLWFRGYGTW